jgi:hypothetical protein
MYDQQVDACRTLQVRSASFVDLIVIGTREPQGVVALRLSPFL